MSYASSKGAAAEREAAQALNDLLGTRCERALREGRRDDCGDIEGLPSCTVQVKSWANVGAAIRASVADLEVQRLNSGARWAVGLVPATFVGGEPRRRRRVWLACTTHYVDRGLYAYVTPRPADVVTTVAGGRSCALVRKGCNVIHIHPLSAWCDWYRESALAAGLL